MARTLITVGAALQELPLIDEAFRQSNISWSKARLLVKIATPENEEAWLERAGVVSCERLGLEFRGSEEGRPPREDGKGVLTVKFPFFTKLAPLGHDFLE